MMWDYFIYFAIVSLLLWWGGAVFAIIPEDDACVVSTRRKHYLTWAFTIAGLVVFGAFIAGIWITMQRPPLRTMGETRLWYSFFLPLAGILIYSRWRYRWILGFSSLLATVFTMINLFKPEIHTTTLMPALQSPWFAPHVIVYMFCYALLGAATLVAIAGWIKPSLRNYEMTDNLIYVGLSFMTLGMLMGALWAKEAWGDYWAWDPKESWAAITWFIYLGYIHLRQTKREFRHSTLAIWLIVAFCCLQMCWWGINYLPSVQGHSVHTYNIR